MRTKEFIEGELKTEYGNYLIRALLREAPRLSYVQVKRIFSNVYYRLMHEGGEDIYKMNKKLYDL